MVLYWYGKNSVGIDSGGHSLVIDPLDLEKELKLASRPGGSAKAAGVVLLSEKHPIKLPAKATSFVIDNPGEYDVKGFFVLGLGGFNSGITYTVEAEGMRLCHLAGLEKELTDQQLEDLADIDILIIDVGASEDENEVASKIVNQIESRVVVPVGYSPEKRPATFLKEMGASAVEPQNKLNLKKRDLPQEEMEVYVLNISK